MKLSQASNSRVIHDSKMLVRVESEHRASELALYRQHPELKMPIMVPVRQAGAKVLWPNKFR
jgi:hypothetical protein